MMPRDRQFDRRRRPLDQILGTGATPPAPIVPTTPTFTEAGPSLQHHAGPVGEGQVGDSPLDTVLGTEEENPWLNPFMEVYEATKTGAMKNLEDIQKMMSETFAHKGGYFGGKHAIAQSDVASKTGSYLDQLLAETSLGASERQYEDWQRSRGEIMSLISLIPGLLGTESFENIVQQPGGGKGQTWQTLANVGGQVGGAAIAASSREFKKDISGIEEEEENRIFEQMKKTPLFNYRYKFESDDNVKHIGLITEESPEELTLFNKKSVGLYEYISMLHATVKVMSRKLEKLENRE